MKHTAVEWFYNELKKLIKESELTDMKPSEFDARESKLINQAKKLEKQQHNSYSEEEMKSAFKIGFSIGYGSPVNGLDSKEETCDVWFNNLKRNKKW